MTPAEQKLLLALADWAVSEEAKRPVTSAASTKWQTELTELALAVRTGRTDR